jgi:HPt (histidine-containing phosphotransfer) domain-containing protein
VERAANEEFDVILMDIHMPELDGIEAMREIRRQRAGKSCPPIIAMTAHALSGDREHYLDAGMDDYLSKPIRTDDLVKLLERVNTRTMAAPWAERGAHHVAIPVSTGPGLGAAPVGKKIDSVPVLDIEQLEDLRYLPSAPGEPTVANDPVGGLIRLFQSKAVERMDLMENMLAAGDWHGLSETSHSLRGASASMGFPRVAALCKDLEISARSLEKSAQAPVEPAVLAGLASLLGQIRLTYAEADRALTVWLASTPLAPAAPDETASR